MYCGSFPPRLPPKPEVAVAGPPAPKSSTTLIRSAAYSASDLCHSSCRVTF